MKTLIISLAMTLAVCFCYAQSEQSIKQLHNAQWREGKERTFEGHTILKKQGYNWTKGWTNLMYMSKEQLQQEYKLKAEREMWKPETPQSLLLESDSVGKGGAVYFYYGRMSIDAANLKNFTVIIHDFNNQEIHRQEMKEKIANPMSPARYWTNVGSALIPQDVKAPFTVYLIDSMGGENSKYVFEIKN